MATPPDWKVTTVRFKLVQNYRRLFRKGYTKLKQRFHQSDMGGAREVCRGIAMCFCSICFATLLRLYSDRPEYSKLYAQGDNNPFTPSLLMNMFR